MRAQAAPHTAICKLRPGEVKRLPLVSARPIVFVMACPMCGFRAQAGPPQHRIGEQPFSLDPPVQCGGCGGQYGIDNGEFVMTPRETRR